MATELEKNNICRPTHAYSKGEIRENVQIVEQQHLQDNIGQQHLRGNIGQQRLYATHKLNTAENNNEENGAAHGERRGSRRGRIQKKSRKQESFIKHAMDDGNSCREYQKKLNFCFIDYIKAFDCVNREILWRSVKHIGIPEHQTSIKNLHEN